MVMIPDIMELKKELIEISDIITAAVVKALKPVEDEISTRKAYAEFGKEWLNYHVSRDHIKCQRRGPHKNSSKVFSRRELLALKEAERQVIVCVKKQLG